MIAFDNPWGLLGLAAVPAVLWLHLYRVRFPPLAIGGLFLWDDAIRRPAGGRTRDRLRSTPSLWLELLAAAALGLLLGGPRIAWETTAPHLVAVLDGSASMGATAGDESPATFRDEALAALSDRAASTGGDTLLTVIESGERPRVVGGPRRPWREVIAALADRPAPAQSRHAFAPSLDLAARLAADGGRVALFTDRNPRALDLPEGVAAVSVGAPRANVALLAAQRGPAVSGEGEGGAGETLFLRTSSFGQTGAVTLTILDADGEPVPGPTLVGSGGGATTTWPLPPGLRGRSLTVRLDAAGDALAADSVAVLLPEPRRPIRAAVEMPSGPARTAVERAVDALPDVERVADPADAELRFLPTGTPLPTESDAWLVTIGPLTGEGDPIDAAGPFLIDRNDPLAAGVSLAGAVWGGAGAGTTTTLAAGGEAPVSPVIAAGDRVLLGRVAGREDAFVLNADPARGTVARTPDWPILVSNLIETRRAALPGLDRANLRVGEAARLTLSQPQRAGEEPLILESLDGGERVELPREPTVTVAPPTVGRWIVRDGGEELARLSVRLADPREANLTGLSAGTKEPEDDEATGTAIDDPAPWPIALLAAAALAAVVADWRATRPR